MASTHSNDIPEIQGRPNKLIVPGSHAGHTSDGIFQKSILGDYPDNFVTTSKGSLKSLSVAARSCIIDHEQLFDVAPQSCKISYAG